MQDEKGSKNKKENSSRHGQWQWLQNNRKVITPLYHAHNMGKVVKFMLHVFFHNFLKMEIVGK